MDGRRKQCATSLTQTNVATDHHSGRRGHLVFARSFRLSESGGASVDGWRRASEPLRIERDYPLCSLAPMAELLRLTKGTPSQPANTKINNQGLLLVNSR